VVIIVDLVVGWSTIQSMSTGSHERHDPAHAPRTWHLHAPEEPRHQLPPSSPSGCASQASITSIPAPRGKLEATP